MPPEDSQSRDVAFAAYHTYQNTTQILAEKFGDDFTANEELFALMACVAQCAVECEIPVSHLIKNLKMMYTARVADQQVKAERNANDTSH